MGMKLVRDGQKESAVTRERARGAAGFLKNFAHVSRLLQDAAPVEQPGRAARSSAPFGAPRRGIINPAEAARFACIALPGTADGNGA